MSLGFGAFMVKTLEDDNHVVYEYGSYDLADTKYRNIDRHMDGLIMIKRTCFVEPEIHRTMRRVPNQRKKLIEKRVPVIVDICALLKEGDIIIENCSNAWKMNSAGIDVMAIRLSSKLLLQYQENSTLPESISYDV